MFESRFIKRYIKNRQPINVMTDNSDFFIKTFLIEF